MNILRLALISLVIFFVLFWVASLFIPSQITVSKAINIAASPKNISAQINDIRNWNHWYPGIENAPPKPTAPNQDSCYVMGNTHVTICFTRRTDTSIQASMSMPGRNAVLTGWNILPYHDSTTVQWYSRIKLRWYPWEKFSSLFFEKTQGSTMEQGLARLKASLQ